MHMCFVINHQNPLRGLDHFHPEKRRSTRAAATEDDTPLPTISCTNLPQRKTYLHRLAVGAGVEHQRAEDEPGRTLFHEDAAAAASTAPPGETET